MCVAFIYLFLWRRSCVFFLSSCWVWGRLLLSLFWCDCSAFFPGASAVSRCVSCSWLPFSGSTPCCLRLADLLLPSGFCTLGGCCNLAPVCWSAPAVVPCGWVEGVFAASLGFLPCAVLFLRACSWRSFPSCRLPRGFPVTGCLSFSFPGGVGWASALPFFFWASPAPLGRWGFAPCVGVLQLQWCLLGLQVRSPCCPSLTLG